MGQSLGLYHRQTPIGVLTRFYTDMRRVGATGELLSVTIGISVIAREASGYACHANTMITCYIEYQIDPYQVDSFRKFCEAWIPIIQNHGGTHHGYFLPKESASDIALGLFSFESLAAYEQYRQACRNDPDAKAASKIASDTRCIIRINRQFLEPMLP